MRRAPSWTRSDAVITVSWSNPIQNTCCSSSQLDNSLEKTHLLRQQKATNKKRQQTATEQSYPPPSHHPNRPAFVTFQGSNLHFLNSLLLRWSAVKNVFFPPFWELSLYSSKINYNFSNQTTLDIWCFCISDNKFDNLVKVTGRRRPDHTFALSHRRLSRSADDRWFDSALHSPHPPFLHRMTPLSVTVCPGAAQIYSSGITSTLSVCTEKRR